MWNRNRAQTELWLHQVKLWEENVKDFYQCLDEIYNLIPNIRNQKKQTPKEDKFEEEMADLYSWPEPVPKEYLYHQLELRINTCIGEPKEKWEKNVYKTFKKYRKQKY